MLGGTTIGTGSLNGIEGFPDIKGSKQNHGRNERQQKERIGNGKKDEPLTVKIGDSVLYGKYAGTDLKFNGKDYLIMREDDILAII